jgi:hypothetical protein
MLSYQQRVIDEKKDLDNRARRLEYVVSSY